MNIDNREYLWNRRWLWVAILIVSSILLSYLKPLKLQEGGEVTYLSMLVIFLVGYFYGGKAGIGAAFLYGILKYVLDYAFVVNVPELWDYILGYGLLGFGGLFFRSKNGLFKGYAFAVLLRYIESVWNCVWFYYQPDISIVQNIRYGLVYCGGYIGTEAVVTLVLLCIPQVREAIEYLKFMATHEYEEDLDTF